MPHMLLVELITPKVAQQLLATMVKNRALSQARVVEYAVAMDEGKWILNGETIKIDKQGRLFDGQSRLNACLLAGKPFRTYVARGIEDENAFATVDVGKNRTHGDIFSISGYISSNQASAAAMVVYALKKTQMGWTGPTKRRDRLANTRLGKTLLHKPNSGAIVSKEDLILFAEPYRDSIVSCVRYAQQSKAKKILAVGVIAGCMVLFREKDAVQAQSFFDNLGEGAGLSSTDPVFHLRERLMDYTRRTAIKMSRWFFVGLTIKAWNKRRAGETVRSLRVQDNEEFPTKIL